MEMKTTRTVDFDFENGIRGLKKILDRVPDDAAMTGQLTWVGSYSSERQEVTGLKFTWTEVEEV